MHADGSPVEFGGNTPTGGKFAQPWDWHGWSADPKHRGDSGFNRKSQSYYDDEDKTLHAKPVSARRLKSAPRRTRMPSKKTKGSRLASLHGEQ
jgi:hypothetical protein